MRGYIRAIVGCTISSLVDGKINKDADNYAHEVFDMADWAFISTELDQIEMEIADDEGR